MDQDPRTAGAAVRAGDEAGERTPEEIQADIERTREQLGDTVEALAAKTDVKARAQERVEEIKENLKGKADQAKAAAPPSAQQGGQQLVDKVRANPAPFILGGAVLLAFLIGRRSARPRF
jgi:ABC-type transporter Mla subunit MlaD